MSDIKAIKKAIRRYMCLVEPRFNTRSTERVRRREFNEYIILAGELSNFARSKK